MQLEKFGEVFYLSWEMMLADQLGAFAKTGLIQVQNWRRNLNRMPLRIFQANPVMKDGQRLFSAAHKNLIAGVGNDPRTSRDSALAAVRALNLAMAAQLAPGAKVPALDTTDAELAYVICGTVGRENLYNALKGKADNDNTSTFIQSLNVGMNHDTKFDAFLAPSSVIGLGSTGPSSPLVMSFLQGLGAAPMLKTIFDEEKDALANKITAAAVCGARTWRGVIQTTGVAP